MQNRNWNRDNEWNRENRGRRGYQGRDQEWNRPTGSRGGTGFYTPDPGESYFGGGGMSYGDGYTGPDFNSPEDTFEGHYGSYGQSNFGEGGGYGQGSYGEGSGQGSYGQSGYGQGGYGQGSGRYGMNRFGGDRGPYGYGGRTRESGFGNRGQSYRENFGGYDQDRNWGNESNDRDWWDKTTDEVSSWFGDPQAEGRRQMDEQHRGQHRGRGPRNYTRSDDRIREDVNDKLTDHPFLDASDIDVQVDSGEVVLSGHVNSRWAKRQAEDIAEECSGVKNVENRIRVEQSWQNQNNSTTTNTTTTNKTNPGESARGKSA